MTTATTPVREGLFRATDEGPTLLASRCASCGRTAFPAKPTCLACGAADPAVVELGAEGSLLCGTTVHMGNSRFQPGYTVGYVTMPHDVRVFTQIQALGGEVPPVGTTMRLELVPMWKEGDDDVVAHRFVPAEEVRDA